MGSASRTRRRRRGLRAWSPLPSLALEALRDHLARQDPPSVLVFPGRDGKMMSGSGFLVTHFHPTLTKAGLPTMRFHDLRHSAATLMTEMELDIVTVSKLLGHSTPAITMKLYGHTTSTLKVRAAHKPDMALGGGRAEADRKKVRPASLVRNGSQMAANA